MLSRRPNDPLAHEILGGVLHQTKRPDQAIAELERALVLDPNLAAAHGGIGLTQRFLSVAPERPKPAERRFPTFSSRQFRLAMAAICGRRQVDSRRGRGGCGKTPPQHRGQSKFALRPLFLKPPPSQISVSCMRRRPRGLASDLTLDPAFTIPPFSVPAIENDNPIFLAGKERILEGMRNASDARRMSEIQKIGAILTRRRDRLQLARGEETG